MLRDYRRRIEKVMERRCPWIKVDKKPLPWRLVSERRTQHSYDYAFEVPLGYSVDDLRQETDALYAACGAVVEIKDKAGVAIVSVYPDDFPKLIPFTLDMLDLACGKAVLLGFNRKGEPIIHSFGTNPHLTAAGMAGYGKTDLLRLILFQLITRFSPEQLEIQIIDLKGFSFLPFRGIPHITRIARDLPGAAAILEGAQREMKRRAQEIWASGDRGKAKEYKWLIVLIDEAAQIAPAMIRPKEERELAYIADSAAAAISCVGREAGVGLLYCTQRPDAEVVNPQIKANMMASIAFRCKTESNSRVIIDRTGAEKLPEDAKGRCIYSTTEDVILQVPYVGDDDAWDHLLKSYRRPNDQRGEETDYIGDLGDPAGGINSPAGATLPQPIPIEKGKRGTKGTRRRKAGGR